MKFKGIIAAGIIALLSSTAVSCTNAGGEKKNAVSEETKAVEAVISVENQKSEPIQKNSGDIIAEDKQAAEPIQSEKKENIEKKPSIEPKVEKPKSVGQAVKPASKEKGLVEAKVEKPTVEAPKSQEAEKAKVEEPKPQEVPAQNTYKYENGTYTGLGNGRGGSLEVEVTVQDNRIFGIKVLSHKDSETLAENIFKVLTAKILDTQSTEVDVISGATLTSKGFIEAVKNSLYK